MNRKIVWPTVGMACAGFLAYCVAADPAWLRATGLDFWNAGPQQRLAEEQARLAEDLDEVLLAAQDRLAANRALTRDVALGRMTLPEGAEKFYAMNRDLPGFLFLLERDFKGPTGLAKAAQLLVSRVERDETLSPAERAKAVARLRAEYNTAFGVPPPGQPKAAMTLAKMA